MEYEIKGRDSIYYTPAVEEWIYKTFDFNVQEAMLYKIILQKKFCTWTWRYLASILRISEPTVGRMLKKFKEANIIAQYTVIVSGNRTRTISIPLYDEDGRIPEGRVKYYISEGIKKVQLMDKN